MALPRNPVHYLMAVYFAVLTSCFESFHELQKEPVEVPYLGHVRAALRRVGAKVRGIDDPDAEARYHRRQAPNARSSGYRRPVEPILEEDNPYPSPRLSGTA